MVKYIALAAGGGLGAMARYLLSTTIHRWADGAFPWGTLGVNLAGCFALGFLWEWFERTVVPPELRTFAFIGILGAFTTFSTFGLETVHLMRGGEYRLALANVLANNLLGIALVLAGMAAFRWFAPVVK